MSECNKEVVLSFFLSFFPNIEDSLERGDGERFWDRNNETNFLRCSQKICIGRWRLVSTIWGESLTHPRDVRTSKNLTCPVMESIRILMPESTATDLTFPVENSYMDWPPRTNKACYKLAESLQMLPSTSPTYMQAVHGGPNAVPELPQYSPLVDPPLAPCMHGHMRWKWFFNTVQ
ncbi:hypothetical protein B0H14DRAFT_3126241 [Mycena olivaceomarginata]|nr:hypothetical protein B0H14DRAFT_3126241 [Mycena olivaceomarginata]